MCVEGGVTHRCSMSVKLIVLVQDLLSVCVKPSYISRTQHRQTFKLPFLFPEVLSLPCLVRVLMYKRRSFNTRICLLLPHLISCLPPLSCGAILTVTEVLIITLVLL